MLPRLLAVLCTSVLILGATGASAVETQITSDPSSDQRPAWSPDGNTIVFDSNRSGNRDLWSVASIGGTATQLTTSLDLDQHPDWAPGSNTIVFSASVGGGLPDIYTIPATGGSPTLLLSDPLTNDRFPAWSPDSSQVAYSKDNDIYTVSSAGGTPVQLTTDPGTDVHPTWSPDGTQVAFLSNRSGNNDIWIIPASGGTATQLTTHTANDGAPDWSPNGDLIAFQSNRAGDNCIWVIPAAGGTATAVTATGGNDVQPDWDPTGTSIAFARANNIWTATISNADLSVGKIVDIATPSEGATIQYTITLTNNGPDAATGIEVTDLLPAGVTFSSAVASSGSYVDGTGVWSVAGLANGGSETLTITATVDTGTSGNLISNTASVTAADVPDPNPANDSDDASITVTGTVTGTFTQLTSVGAADQRPGWSPDGNTIVFDSNRASVRDLWLIPAAGGTATQLTTNIEIDQHADWAPGSANIVFSAVMGGGQPDLYEIPATGGPSTLLFADPGTNDRFPAWSPDSSQIAYSRDNDIYVMPAGGGTPVQVTTDPGTDLHPSWSPDGTQLVFLSNRSGNNDLWTIPAAGGAATQLTTHSGNDGAPDWSPNGLQIAFQSNRAGNNDIWVIPAAGGTASQITTDTGNDVQPDWAPDSQSIVYSSGNNLWIFSYPQADIAIAKSADVSNPNEGDAVQFTVGATNNGPGAASSVEVTDLLPAGLTFVSASATQGSYVGGTGVWTVGTLANGASATLTIDATVDAGTGGSTLVNTATRTGSSPTDPNPSNDSALAAVVVKSADLAVVKLVDDSNPNIGDTVEFTVFLLNFGPSSATNIEVSDPVPAGLTFVSATTTSGTYNDVTGLWNLPAKTPSPVNADTLKITATVDPSAAGATIENVATVTSVTESDPNPLNNTFSAFLTVQSADLGVTKLANTATASEGDHVTYTIVVTNDGPNAATNVQVSEPLPFGVTFTADDATKGTYDMVTGLWDVGAIAVGTSDTLDVAVTVDVGAGGSTIVNNAVVLGADQGDPNPANDSDDASIEILVALAGTETQLTTAGSDQRPAWAPDNSGIAFDSNRSGNRDLWRIPVGGGTATQFTTNIDLDQHADYSPSATRIVFSASSGGGLPDLYEIPAAGGAPTLLFADPSNDRFPSWSPDSTQIAYSRNDDIYIMPAGGGTPTQLTTDPGTDAHPSWSPDGTEIVFLSNRSGNNDLWTIPSTGGAATQVTTHTGNDGAPDWSPDGTQLAFQSNRGGTGNDVWVIPSTGGTATQLTSTTDNNVQPDWSPSGGQIVFARGGNLWQFAFNGADLNLQKSVNNATPNEGESIDYTIVVTNNGPDAATGVSLADALPAGVSFVSASESQGSYDDGTGLWAVGSLSVGSSATLTLTATVDGGTTGSSITNNVSVAALDQNDPGPADDTASADIVVQSADLEIAKSVDDGTPNEGQSITYTVVASNNGPDAATNVDVTDLLPAGVTFQSAAATQGTYTDGTGLWDLGGLASGAADTLTITATVDALTGGSLITNTASVTAADQADPIPGNDSDSADITVEIPVIGAETQITTAGSDQRPAWSPDGVEIVFDSNRMGNRDLWSVPAFGGSATQLTTSVEIDQHADWSPDASKLVFSAVVGGGLPDLYTIPRTGGAPTLLLADPATNDRFPSWSPDSTQIAYSRDNDIYVIAATGGSPTQLTTHPGTDLHPTWSPDGTQIAFLSNRSGNNDIWVMASTGGLATQLTTNSANDGAPDWSPDGATMAFQSNRGGNNDIWIIPSAGGTATQVTTTADNDVQPDWSPSGGQITFARSGDIWVTSFFGADIGISKAVSSASPNEGESIDYTITATNFGPDAAANVKITDLLPAGVTFVSSSATQGAYNDGTGEWDVPSMASTTSETLTITVTVNGGTGGTTINNIASVTSLDQTDPGSANDTDSIDITVQLVDIAVAKVVDNGTPDEGAAVTYTVDVTNNGPDGATGVEVTDLLPAGVTYTGDTPTQGAYVSGTGVWTVGALGNGQTETLTITASVDAGTGGSLITNTAAVTAADQADSDAGNDSDSADVTVNDGLDIAVAKSVDNGSPDEGDTVTYTVDVTNNGAAAATGVEVTDLLPAGVTYSGDTPTQGAYVSGTGVWTVGALSNGQTETLTITATVDAGAGGSTITNTADLTGVDQTDGNAANDSDSAGITVGDGLDIAVAKAVDNGSPDEGDTVTYTVDVTNNGPAAATGVEVTDLLPAGVTYSGDTPTQGAYVSGTGVWTVGALSNGQTETLTITATVDAGAGGSTITNTADLTGVDQTDGNAANDSDSAGITVGDGLDIAVAKAVDNGSPDEGDTVTYTVDVTNNGPAAATGVEVTDLLPAGVTYSGDTPTQGAYVSGTGAWTVGALSNGQTETLTITATVDAGSGGSTITNTADLTGVDQTDGNAANDSDSAGITVGDGLDIAVAKAVDIGSPDEGDTVTYTVDVTNNGAAAATGVEVTDLLPAGVTYSGDTPTQGAYVSGTGVWTVGALSNGQTETLTITATVDAGSGGSTITNTADLTGVDQTDGNAANDSDSAGITVGDGLDIAVAKAVDNGSPDEGDTVTYTVDVTNNGAAAATGVEVTDLLPAGVTYSGDTPTQGAYVSGTGVWTVGALSNGQTETLTITATVDAGAGGSTITNTADLTGVDQTDGNAANDSDSAGITVGDGLDIAVAKVVDNGSPDEGDTVTYTVDVTNNGAAAATGVEVTDLLPAGVTYSGDTPTQGAYVSGTGVWTVGALSNGQTETLTITATVDAGSGGSTITNTADLTGVDQTDGNAANDSDSAGITVGDGLDIAVAKAVDNGSPDEGDTVTYTVDVTNNGAAAATGVEVTDLLPAGVTYSGDTPTQGAYVSGTGVWTVGALSNGQTETLTITATVDAGSGGSTITNTADLTGVDQTDGNAANDSDSAGITVGDGLDIAVAKAVDNGSPDEGDTVTYTVDVTNNGAAAATGVEVTDLLPAGVTYSVDTPTQGAYVSGTGVWTVGALSNGQTETLTITATVDAGSGGSTITNTADLTGVDQTDGNAANDSDSAGITVGDGLDIAVAKAVDNGSPDEGDTVTYTVDVTNNGAAAATGVEVTDLLPAGVTYSGDTPTQGAYVSGTGVWTVGALSNGQTETLTITATVDAGTGGSTITNTADLTGVDQTDTNAANDSDSAGITVGDGLDIAVAKAVDDGSPDEGDTVTYTVDVTNNGPAAATGVEVTDLLPAGVTYSGDTPTQGAYVSGTGVWTVGALSNGQTETLTITATVDAGSGGSTITNTADLTGVDQTDGNAANDSDSAGITVGDGLDIAVAKVVDNGSPDEGDTVTYTVDVTNNGPAAATGVEVTDLLPAGVTYTGDTPTQGAYVSGTGVWTVGALSNGQTETLTITATVNTGTGGSTITNTADLTGVDQTDGNAANDSDSAGITVGDGLDIAVAKAVDNGSPDEGDTVTYTVDVTNNGPAAATGVEVTDLLPAGVTYTGDTPTQGAYVSGTGVWTVGALSNGQTETLTITASVDAGTGGSTITNTADLTGVDQTDTNGANDSDSAGINVNSVDLALTKTVDDGNPAESDNVTFTLTLTNTSSQTATTVGVTDILPAGLAFLSYDTSQGVYESGTGFWAVGPTDAGTSETLTITAKVLVGTAGTLITNTASITSVDQGDGNPGNDTDSADVNVIGTGGLAISSQNDRTFFTGDPATTISPITITDDSNVITAANDLRVRVPAGFSMDWDTSISSATISGSAAAKVSGSVSYEDAGKTLVLDVTTDFAAGDQIVVSSLKFTTFGGTSPTDKLELEIDNDGLASALDNRTVAIAPAGPIATRSTAIEITPDGQEVWVVNPDHATVAVIGTQGANENVKLAEINVGAEPWTLDIHPSNGEVWVASMGAHHVYIIDAVSRAVIDSIPAGFETFGVSFNPAGTVALVTASGSDQIFAIDVATRTIAQTFASFEEPRGIAWRADGARAWVSHLTTTRPYGLLTTVFTGSWTTTNIGLTAIIDDTLGGVPNTLQNITMGPAPGDSILWIPNVLENSAAGALAGNPLTPQNTLHAAVRTVNVRPMEPSDVDQSTYYLSESGTSVSGPTAVDFKNGKAYVANMSSDDVTVLTDEFLNPAEVAVVGAGQTPIGVVTHRGLDRAYVANWLSRDVTVIDTDTDTVVATVGSAAIEPLGSQTLNGKRLFFSSTGQMSQDHRIACASCHQFGRTDGQAWDLSQFGRYVRATPDLRGSGETMPHTWTASFDEMADHNLEILNIMGGDGLIPGGGNPPLGPPNGGLSQDMDDIGAWIASLDHRPDTPVRVNGVLSADALAGQVIFRDPMVGCADCHSGTRYTDSTLLENPFVKHDVGTCDPEDEDAMEAGFDTPSLIGVWATAPYLHDNRAATLMDVLTTHNPNDLHGTTSHLSPAELDQLVAFVESITIAPEGGATDAGVDLPNAFRTQFDSVFPNPFAAETSLRFSLENPNSQVVIEIFNIEGRRVRTLMDRRMPRGTHVVGWDGRNGSGQSVAAGFYYARLIVDDEKKGGKKMTLLR